MPSNTLPPLMAVDVGNSRIKFGQFAHPLGEPLPEPARFARLPLDWSDADLEEFLPHDPAAHAWAIASVNRPAAKRLFEWLAANKVERVQQLAHTDLPLAIDLPRPERVGLDRLANAVAANRLRAPDRAAIVIDMGSAIKVDFVSATGAFAGGAILPGISMAARALHERTDLLPLVEVRQPPAPLGTSTQSAIESGLYWGAVGAVRELVSRLADERATVEIFLTGGAASTFAAHLAREDRGERFVPHLTLAGIALATLGQASAKGLR